MAVINESGDKMRDIIAASAKELVDNPDEGTTEEGVVAEEPAAAEELGVEETPAAEPVVEEADKAVVEPVVEKPAGEAIAAGAVKPAAKTPAELAAAKDQKTKEEQFEKLHGLKAKDKHGRENRIPHSVVANRIIPNAIKAEKAKWETEVLAPERAKVQTYEGRLNAIAETERIQFEEPRRFLTMLGAIPGYRQLFDELNGGKFTAGGEKAAKPADGTVLAPADDPMPTADVKDTDGKVLGWSNEGMEKRFAWERRQAATAAATTAQANLEKTYKPMRDRFDSVTAGEKTAADIDGIIGLAAEWPGFTENHAAILDEVAKGTVVLDTPQKMYRAVQDAYNTVMFGVVHKVKETEEERRDRYFTEFQETLRKSPRSAAARSTVRRDEPVEEVENASPDDRMRNIIAQSVQKAGLLK